MENEILIDFIWLPSKEELLDVKLIPLSTELKKLPPVLERLRAFLKKLLDLSVIIQRLKSAINSESSESPTSMFFAEYLFTVTCVFEFNSNSDSKKLEFYKKLIRRFCDQNAKATFPELYLDIDASLLIENPLHTGDHFIDLKGFSLGNVVKLNTFVEHFNSETSLNSYDYKITQVKVKFLHDEKMLFLNFVVGNSKVKVNKRSPETHRMFCLEIPYSLLHTILLCPAKVFSVYLRLYKPPMLYAVHQNEDFDNYVSYKDLTSSTTWIRDVNLFKDCPSHIRKEFVMNSVLCLKFRKEDFENKNDFEEVLKIMFRHKSVQVNFAFMNVVPFSPGTGESFSEKIKDMIPSLKIKSFECYYGYQCLLTHSYELIDQLMIKEEMEEFKNLIMKNFEKNGKALSDIFYKIFSAINMCHIVVINHSIKSCLEKMSPISGDSNTFPTGKNENVLLVKRAFIIPTHVQFLPPHPILKSRALRSCDPDYSLRLSIRDVNLNTINFSFKSSNDKKKLLKDFFQTCYVEKMLKGIKVGNRIYKYVGSSTSQLKGHGLWFYAKDEKGLTADILRENFGNMEAIKDVPKYMARMGQTFTQAMDFIIVPQKYTNVDDPEDDIEGGVKEYLSEDFDDINKKFLKTAEDINSEKESKIEPYTFSDGIGRISLEIAEEVRNKLELDKIPAAMQIRYAGCKGMLVLDPNLKGKQISFRKSMRKFISKDESLEIIKVNEPRVASLNRPLITILEQLGVPKEIFIKLQKLMIQNHIKSMFYEPEACTFLQRNSKLRIDFLEMHKNGISFTEDPLFRSMIYALFRKHLELLKSKANIEIPPDKGRSVFGTLDETSTLEYGQVFFQYTSFETQEIISHEGTVVITKNPCMHPGDVRKFEAVYVKELSHIADCIVFPAKGPRPHPDEMAGSDLDGDEYLVMWYEDFIFEGNNEEAMHYAIEKNKVKKDDDDNQKIKPADELEHLGNFIVNDNVGLIASAHLAFADKEKGGIFSENCLRLARKYAVALDFAKSGKIAPKHHKDSIHSYPDFMQKFGERDTYVSKKALGVLYRNCKRLELGLESTQTEVAYKLDQDLVYENWEIHEKPAKKIYKYYCRKIEYLMNTYSFCTEGELLTGAMLNPPKYYEQRHDLDNLMPLIEYEIRWIFKDLENTFFKTFGGKPDNNNFTDAMFQKASAWYIVAYNENKSKGDYGYFGLPWAIADVLIKLKQNKCRLGNNKVSNCKSVLEDTIDKHLSHLISPLSEDAPIIDIFENRLEVLDVAKTVLERWLDTQKDCIIIEDLKKFREITTNEFDAVADLLLSCNLPYINRLKDTNNLKKAISPAYFILETLLRLSCIKIPDKRRSVFDVKQEISLLSWVTLIKLACTYSPDYLGIGDTSCGISLIPQDNVVSIFRVNLLESDEYNDKFSLKLVQKPKEVFKYLQKVSKIKDVDVRCTRYGNTEKNLGKFVAIFTVMGSRYAIEKLKDLVVQEDFCMWVVKDKTLYATQS